jgi:hypothetical protein
MSFIHLTKEQRTSFCYLYYLQNSYEKIKNILNEPKDRSVFDLLVLWRIGNSSEKQNFIETLKDFKTEDKDISNVIASEIAHYYSSIMKDSTKAIETLEDLKENLEDFSKAQLTYYQVVGSPNTSLKLLGEMEDSFAYNCYGSLLLRSGNKEGIQFFKRSQKEFSSVAMVVLGDHSFESPSISKKYYQEALKFGWEKKDAQDHLLSKKFDKFWIERVIESTYVQTSIPSGEARRKFLKNSLLNLYNESQKSLTLFQHFIDEIHPFDFIFPLCVIELKNYGYCSFNGDTGYLEQLLVETGDHKYDSFDSFFQMNGLHIASFYDHPQVLELFHSFSFNIIDSKNKFGLTPLHIACMKGNISCIKKLLHLNCDIHAVDNHGRNALHWSILTGQIESLKMLTNSFVSNSFLNSNIESKDNNGYTALHYATILTKIDFISYLLSLGANVDVQCLKGDTPFNHCNKILDPKECQVIEKFG